MPLFLRNITFKCKGTSCLQSPLKWVKKIIKQQDNVNIWELEVTCLGGLLILVL